MIRKNPLLLTLALAALVTGTAAAQEPQKGYLAGSFETNTIYYRDDAKTNATAPDDHFGSNNFLKLDYYRGKLAVGVQMEAYLPVLQSFPTELTGTKLTNYYVTWQDDAFSVTAGTFYDQFGSGLLFRSWEDRMLGMNNALMGARFVYNYKNIVAFKAIWGLPRLGMEFSETQVRGADLSFSLAELLKWNNTSLSLEGSVLSRYEKITQDLIDEGGKPNSEGYSGRIYFERSGFSLKAEYVDAGKKYAIDPEVSPDKDIYLQKNGSAQLLELGYNRNGLGISLSGRRLEWMRSEITSNGNLKSSSANLLNYIPAMCTQYTYMLTNLHPYTAQTGDAVYNNSGEIGGQADIFYSFKRGSALGGKRGLKIHANFSTYYTLNKEGTAKAGKLLYRDISIDVEKQFTRKFKAVLLYSMQEENPSYGRKSATRLQNVFVADMQYKFTPKFSTRLELQYLTTHEDEKDWMAALLEINFAPAWSIYGSDMYNSGSSKIHYFNAGVSYARSRTRIALSYGRNREGLLCSGGVCRLTRAYTGANLQITTSF